MSIGNHQEVRYLRFGNPPPKPRSVDHLTGERLAGVSVYEGWLEDGGEEYVDEFTIDTSRLNLDHGISNLLLMAALDRPAFFIEGEEIGEGPDGEPLVAVDRYWPVPLDTDVSCTEEYAQPALELWSSGPRDETGVKLVQWRLGNPEAGYLPPGWPPLDLAGRRRAINTAQGKKSSGADKKKKDKAAKAARKKNRKK